MSYRIQVPEGCSVIVHNRFGSMRAVPTDWIVTARGIEDEDEGPFTTLHVIPDVVMQRHANMIENSPQTREPDANN